MAQGPEAERRGFMDGIRSDDQRAVAAGQIAASMRAALVGSRDPGATAVAELMARVPGMEAALLDYADILHAASVADADAQERARQEKLAAERESLGGGILELVQREAA